MTLVPIPHELPAWVGEMLQKMIAPVAEETGQMGKDLLRYARARIQLRFFEKFKQNCEHAHINLKHVNLPVLFDILQRGPIEEDEELQTLWANLLANAADSRGEVSIRKEFPQILSQISSKEAAYLNEMFEVMEKAEAYVVKTYDYSESDDTPKLDPVSYDNLQRLRLIDSNPETIPAVAVTASLEELRAGASRYKNLTEETYLLTFLGRAFVKACKAPKDGS
ncbi:MAG TPA: Abi-alpha family protein [Candidatus Angelobacter sp.]|nr:Abi-alpha family protein [Candidatus Angelobacter sp.]